VATGDPVRELPGHTDVVTGLAFGPGAMLVSAGGDGVRIWDTDSARCREHLVDAAPGAPPD
jgi:WD40 repeat protein